MKITAFKTTLVDLPLDKPIATAIHQMKSVGCVLLELETDQAHREAAAEDDVDLVPEGTLPGEVRPCRDFDFFGTMGEVAEHRTREGCKQRPPL